jgi:hypothetical protein
MGMLICFGRFLTSYFIARMHKDAISERIRSDKEFDIRYPGVSLQSSNSKNTGAPTPTRKRTSDTPKPAATHPIDKCEQMSRE